MCVCEKSYRRWLGVKCYVCIYSMPYLSIIYCLVDADVENVQRREIEIFKGSISLYYY